tara:strand:- start:386 stop:1225 length:840 start_codon:yes stop_codon:yes gene_type:complete
MNNNVTKDWKGFLNELSFDPSKLIPKKILNKSVWSAGKIDPKVNEKLLQIAEDFYNHLNEEVPGLPELEDVIFTGSLASYNYHSMSDIDLHLLIDFNELDVNDKDVLEKYFAAKRINWNKAHNIFINGHEVEIYVQDKNEKHLANGIYSIKNNNWIKIPKKEEVSIDLETAEKKYKNIANEIKELSNMYDGEEYSKVYEKSQLLKNKIKNMRQSGLNDEGIYSAENMAFKLLRNNMDLEKLSNLKNNSYDKLMSHSSGSNIKISLLENWWQGIKKEKTK